VSLFGAIGECAKCAYVPSPIGRNAFFSQDRPKRKSPIKSSMATIFFDQYELFFFSKDLFKVGFYFRAFLFLSAP
jgi:hypothetical protein